MKKTLTLMLALSMLVLLCACGEGGSGTSTVQTTSSSATTQPTGTSCLPTTGTTTAATVPVTTTQSSTTTAPTSPPTTVTTRPTKPSTTASTTAETDYAHIFREYPELFYDLAWFSSADNLSAYSVFTWCRRDMEPSARESYWDSEYAVDVFKFYYSVDELDKITLQYLGRTWDYSTILNTDINDFAQYSLDPDTNMVVLTYLIEVHELPPSDPRLRIEYRKYTAIDSTHFEIEYLHQIYYGPEYIKTEVMLLGVTLEGGNYIVTYHHKK